MNILIIYGTVEGQTRKIARFVKKEAENLGNQVTLSDATDDPPDPDDFDAIIIGSSVHKHEYNAAIIDYASKHLEVLNKKPSLFISVSLTAAADEEESWKELEQITKDFLAKVGWNPTAVKQVAGALRYSEYDFFKRFIMRLIAKKQGGGTDTSQDYEYTNWEELGKSVNEFLSDSSK